MPLVRKLTGLVSLSALLAVLALTCGSIPAQTAQAGAAAAGAQPRNVLLIGWDGAQRAHVHELLDAGKLPNLAALAKEGALVDIDVTTGATDTKAGWTQILTGYVPAKTGVVSNARYQPIPAGYTVMERLRDQFGADGVATLAVIAKKGNVDADGPRKVPYERYMRAQQRRRARKQTRGSGAIPPPKAGKAVAGGGTVVEENGKFYVQVPGKPYFNVAPKMDLWVNGLTDSDVVGRRALDTLEAYRDRRMFFFIHFGEPDHPGHRYGENSEEYSAGIIKDDAWLGRIVAKLKELGIYGQTLVYVTADHGFDEGKMTHTYAPYVFLGTNDKLVTRAGDRADVAPTVLKRFGVDLGKLEPKLDGVPLDEPAPAGRTTAPPTPPPGHPRLQ